MRLGSPGQVWSLGRIWKKEPDLVKRYTVKWEESGRSSVWDFDLIQQRMGDFRREELVSRG